METICGRHIVIWPHEDSRLQQFLDHLNGLRPEIQFTMEKEEDRLLPFLDVQIKREGNRLTTTVYRKRTHTDRYLNNRSYQVYKKGMQRSATVKAMSFDA